LGSSGADYDAFLEVAVEAARRAGRELADASTREIEVIEEMPGDIKLVMDRRAEDIIIGTILDRFPDHSFMAEESGATDGAGDIEWVIDPLDGTTNYSRRIPHWCTCIAAVHGGEPVAGVVYDPLRDEMYTARQGGGAFLNGEPIRVNERDAIQGSIIAWGIYHRQAQSVEKWRVRAPKLAMLARSTRNVGSAGLHTAYVACGRVDAFVESGVFPWDVTAGIVLVREAGGRVSHWPVEGGALDIILASSGLHDALVGTGMWPG